MQTAVDPYASHLPTLNFVLGLVKPRKVLELGAGLYSTKAFLDFPSVERLLTIETDKNWVPEPDERLTLRLVEDTVEALPSKLTNYDLVFVDNADNMVDRERTIRAVLSREHPVTVVHDAEVAAYHAAIEELSENVAYFAEHLPATAVCW